MDQPLVGRPPSLPCAFALIAEACSSEAQGKENLQEDGMQLPAWTFYQVKTMQVKHA